MNIDFYNQPEKAQKTGIALQSKDKPNQVKQSSETKKISEKVRREKKEKSR